MKSGTITLVIDSALDNVALVGIAVSTISREAGFSPEAAAQTELALAEAVNNAIEHAYGNNVGNDVEIIIELSAENITFTVCDTGNSLKALNVPELDFDPGCIASLPEGGMGLYLIHQFMDAVSYESSGGKNRLIMVKKFSEQHAPC